MEFFKTFIPFKRLGFAISVWTNDLSERISLEIFPRVCFQTNHLYNVEMNTVIGREYSVWIALLTLNIDLYMDVRKKGYETY